MTILEKGDEVGLFHSYGPDLSIYLGLAEYIGHEKVESTKGLSKTGAFDAKHIPLAAGPNIVGPGSLAAFKLRGSGQVVYEQEAWYAPEPLLTKLLKNTDEIKTATIEELREQHIAATEKENQLPLFASGFVQIYLNFEDILIPEEDIGDDEEFDVQAFLADRIALALSHAGFERPDEMKFRELDEERREPRGDTEHSLLADVLSGEQD